MHDVASLEGRGIPSVGVASDAFVEASRAQSAQLGFDPAVVFVKHPIQDRTDDELRALAEAAFERILAEIVGG